MNYIELSIKDLEKECVEWAKEIKKTFCPDLIVYVAKAGYLIARPMKDVFAVPLVGISATREGNKLKEAVGSIISLLPNFVRNFLISVELKSDIHNKNTERRVSFHKGFEKVKKNHPQKILVIDDSVDTGHSMRQVVEAIKDVFDDAEIRVAGLNVWDKSSNVIDTNYALYENTVIKTPMSKDSKQYKEFLNIYNEETCGGSL